jgi:hypothetical protein
MDAAFFSDIYSFELQDELWKVRPLRLAHPAG